MAARISKAELEAQFNRYARAVEALGIKEEGHELTLVSGSAYYGNSFKAVWESEEHGGHKNGPGTYFNGFIGWTKREAYDALGYISRALEDVLWYRNLSQ